MAVEALFVFAYDVTSDRARRRLAAVLEKHGTRVQESVFEVHTTQKRAEALFERVDRCREDGDRLRMYCLSGDGLRRSRTAGGTPLPEQTEFWLL